jgi:hypothetical protein
MREVTAHAAPLVEGFVRSLGGIGVLIAESDVVVDEVAMACTSGQPFGTFPNLDQANSDRRSVSQ